MIANLLGWVLLWCVLVFLIRSVVPSKHAASFVSLVRFASTFLAASAPFGSCGDIGIDTYHRALCLVCEQTYCIVTVFWGSATLLRATWPKYAFDFSLKTPKGATLGIDDFLQFSIAYFATDLVFDPDPRFVVHHVLTISAMVTVSACSTLQGALLLMAVMAEIGGVMYHMSKIVQEDKFTRVFLYVYSFTRLVLMPVFIGWLCVGLHHDFRLSHLWATCGTGCLVALNVSWCLKQWARYHRETSATRPIVGCVRVVEEEDGSSAMLKTAVRSVDE